jgi:hypothetical protein
LPSNERPAASISLVTASSVGASGRGKVKRREPCAHVVRIGARVDKRSGQIEMAVLHREHQRAHASRRVCTREHHIHIDPRRKKRTNYLGMAMADGEEERRFVRFNATFDFQA